MVRLGGLKHDTVQRGFFLSVATGYISSFVTLFVNLFGLPVLARTLPAPEMAIYVAVSAISSMVFWGQLGAGPTLTQRVAKGNASGDRESIRRHLASAAALVGAVSLIAVIAGLWALFSGSFSRFYGLPSRSPSNSLNWTLLACIAISAVSLVISPLARAQAGLHQSYRRNITTAIANVFVLVGLVFVAPRFPLAGAAFLVAFLPPLVFDLYTVTKFAGRNRALLANLPRPTFPDVRIALFDSLAYFTFEVSALVVREAMKGSVGRDWGSVELAKLGLLIQAATIMQALANQVTMPLLPVLANYHESGNHRQARKVYLKTLLSLSGLSAVGGLVAIALGPKSLEILFGHRYQFTMTDLLGVLFLGISNILRFLNAFTLFGLSLPKVAVGYSLVGGLLMAAALSVTSHSSIGAFLLTQGIVGCLVHGLAQSIHVLQLTKKDTPPSPTDSEPLSDSPIQQGIQ